MLQNLLRAHTGTANLYFEKSERDVTDCFDDFPMETLACCYRTNSNEPLSIHITTFDFEEFEIRPVISYMTEQIRTEISTVAHQIIDLMKEYALFSQPTNPSTARFVFSDLLIADFGAYEERQSLTYFFRHKKDLLETYRTLTQEEWTEKTYDTERKLVLFGKDGRQLASFLREWNIADIVYSQDELLSILSFKQAMIHYHFHLHYFKQLFNDLGYVCHFLDNSITQRVIDKSAFLREGGKYDIQNHFFI